jgi:hypothetical protein
LYFIRYGSAAVSWALLWGEALKLRGRTIGEHPVFPQFLREMRTPLPEQPFINIVSTTSGWRLRRIIFSVSRLGSIVTASDLYPNRGRGGKARLDPTMQRRIIIVQLGIMLASFAFLSALGATPADRVLTPVRFEDKVREGAIPVSGGVFVGAVSGDGSDAAGLDALMVYLSGSEPERLCLSVASRDGRYVAEAEYKVGGLALGQYRLILPSQHLASLRGYRAEDLAVLVEAKGSCSDRGHVVLPAMWRAEADRSHISLLVNSGGTDTRVYLPASSSFVPCEGFSEGKSLAYDVRCTIALPSTQEVVIVRQRFENRMADIRATLQK